MLVLMFVAVYVCVRRVSWLRLFFWSCYLFSVVVGLRYWLSCENFVACDACSSWLHEFSSVQLSPVTLILCDHLMCSSGEPLIV